MEKYAQYVFLGKCAASPSLVSHRGALQSSLHLLTAQIHLVDYHHIRLVKYQVQHFLKLLDNHKYVSEDN